MPKTKVEKDIEREDDPWALPWFDDDPEDGDEKGAKAAEADDKRLDELNTRIEQMAKGMEDLRRANMQLMQTPVQPSQSTATPQPTIDFKGLPDPADDPEAYARELTRRTEQYHAQRDRIRADQGRQAEAQGQRYQALYEDFIGRYDEWADEPQYVEMAARKVASQAAARGMDLERYMFNNSEQFMQDVDAEMKRVFKRAEAGAEEEEEPKPRTRHGHRTGGMLGGNASGNKPSRPAAFDHNAEMAQDLREFQLKTGFHA